MRKGKALVCMMISAVMVFTVSCNLVPRVSADNLMVNIKASEVETRDINDKFTGAMADFAVSLFQSACDKTESSMISPLSVMLALSMAANGASENTLKEMENVLGGGMPVSELNSYLKTYREALPNTKKARINISNSVWFKENHHVIKKSFLQTNADYYGAAAFSAKFDGSTITDINKWVKNGTRGMIDKIVDKIDVNDFMILINTIAFEAEWGQIYYQHQVVRDDFTTLNGDKKSVDFLSGTEYKFISDESATGFIKPYAEGYSFAALLPNEDVTLDEYIMSMTGESLLNTFKNSEDITTYTRLPKFEYEYNIEMNNALISMGMGDAFADTADFSNLTDDDNDAYISQVLHKTFISVTEKGTKAGAATKVTITDKSAAGGESFRTVTLDRPFIYAIIDNLNSLPVFIGTVTDIK